MRVNNIDRELAILRLGETLRRFNILKRYPTRI